MNNKFLEVLERFGELPMLVAVRRGLVLVLPLIFVGATALLILNLPVPQLHNVLTSLFGNHWRALCQLVQQGSFSIAGLAVLICISASYAKLKSTVLSGHSINPRVTSIVCLSCYFVVAAPVNGEIPKGFFSLGGGGFPIALCVAVISTPLFIFFLRYLHINNFFRTEIGDSECGDALAAVPSALIILLIFGLVRVFLEYVGLNNLHMQAQNFFAAPFIGEKVNLLLGIKYLALSQLFWFFGVHGPNLLCMVETKVLVPGLLENASAVSMGGTPNIILTKPFLDAFVHIGGSGATLGLIFAVLLRGKDISTRRLAIVALLPALFNVNEVILFGLPLVLNPIFAIPFFLAPVAQVIVAYIATALELVPVTQGNIHWTSPPLIGGYVATGSSAGAILQVVCLGVGVLVYLPFVRLANTMHSRRFIKSMNTLCLVAEKATPSFGRPKFTDLPGQEGQLAKTLAFDLLDALKSDDQIYLEYQPQIDVDQGIPIGAEALVRWNHPIYGRIPPHVAVALAEDTETIISLGMLVLNKACAQHKVLIEKGFTDAVLSVNMSGTQFQDKALVDKVREVLYKTGLSPHLLKLEVTETMALSAEIQTVEMLSRLRDIGVLVAIDDFGMGHTSLRYLNEFPVNTIKIDRSLTQETTDGISEHIISSIVHLCEALGVQIVVEGVETEAQLERFRSHRCNIFQGYLFSKPLSSEAYIRFFEQEVYQESEKQRRGNHQNVQMARHS